MKHKNIEPGIPGFITDLIKDRPSEPAAYPKIPWTCSYQGETDYKSSIGELRFRWAKVSCKTGHWNYRCEEEFEQEHNGNWGLVTRGTEPVDSETLETFRREHCPTAGTGYFDCMTHRWVECEPMKGNPSMDSWLKFRETQEYRDRYESEPVAA